MVNREVYSKSKTAPTEEEREKFRQEYLDRKGNARELSMVTVLVDYLYYRSVSRTCEIVNKEKVGKVQTESYRLDM